MRAFVVLALLASPVQATLITINASDYEEGELVSAPGVRLLGVYSPEQPSGTPSVVYTTNITVRHDDGDGAFPPWIFSGANTQDIPHPHLWSPISDTYNCYYRHLNGPTTYSSQCAEGWSLFEAIFDEPTNYVEMVGGHFDSMGPLFYALDAEGQFVSGERAFINGGNDGDHRYSVTYDDNRVSRVWYGGSPGPGVVALSSLTYAVSVPEPGALLMLSSGLLGLILGRPKAKR